MTHTLSFIITFILVLSAILLQLFSPLKKKQVNLKIFAYVLIAVFAVRYLSYHDRAPEITLLSLSPFTPALTIISVLTIWFELTAVITLMIYPFYPLKSTKNFLKFVVTPLMILFLVFSRSALALQFYGQTPTSDPFIFSTIMFSLESGLIVYGLFLLWREDFTFKLNKSEVINLLKVILPLFLASMPMYIPQYILGPTNPRLEVLDLSVQHRMFIYAAVIIPILIFLALHKKDEKTKYFAMIFLSVATMITFSYRYSYQSVLEPWNLPLHLCNTAMYILPLSLIFRMKKLFYFTYFINVFGALIAMLMPNYSASILMTNHQMITFWFNHSIAFFMPLLLVALGLFERPKLKQMYYSIFYFSLYFVLVLILNVWFSNYASVDYFFLNTDFIADKLGRWALKLFQFNVSFTIGDLSFVFRPLYQAIYLVVYIALSFAMWFVYSLGYSVHDSLGDLMRRRQKIKFDALALKASPEYIKRRDTMENIEASLVLTAFSKRYGKSERYAVKDASLVIKGGEIFGFLGPNGAGKSTTIKAIVGIIPLTEGSISVCGFDVSKEAVAAKAHIGYVPDHYSLYEKLTAREYVNYIADIYKVSVEKRTALIDEYVKIFHLEEAFDFQIKTFSHGMKQKVTIIAALVHEPKLWLLDEPLTGLDPDSIYQVKEAMRAHASKGNIVLFSSHLIDVVENLCERVAIIKKGHLFAPVVVKEITKTQTLEDYYLETTINDQAGEEVKVTA